MAARAQQVARQRVDPELVPEHRRRLERQTPRAHEQPGAHEHRAVVEAAQRRPLHPFQILGQPAHPDQPVDALDRGIDLPTRESRFKRIERVKSSQACKLCPRIR